MNEVIEDDILDKDDIDINYDVFIDEDIVEGNVKKIEVINSQEEPTHPQPSRFVSCTFYIFTKRLYTYMVYHLQHEVEATS